MPENTTPVGVLREANDVLNAWYANAFPPKADASLAVAALIVVELRRIADALETNADREVEDLMHRGAKS